MSLRTVITKNEYIREYANKTPENFMSILDTNLKSCWPNAILLSKKYQGISSQYLIKCDRQKHERYYKAYLIITQNLSCGPCTSLNNAQQKVSSILQEISKIYNATCLTKIYNGPNEKIQFICENNHEFSVSYINLKNKGSWCNGENCQKRGPERDIMKQQIINIIERHKDPEVVKTVYRIC